MFLPETRSDTQWMNECELSADKTGFSLHFAYRFWAFMIIGCWWWCRVMLMAVAVAEEIKWKADRKVYLFPSQHFITGVFGGRWKQSKENLFHYKVYSRKIINQMRISHLSHLYTFQNHVESFLVLILDEWLMRDAPLLCGGVRDEEGWNLYRANQCCRWLLPLSSAACHWMSLIKSFFHLAVSETDGVLSKRTDEQTFRPRLARAVITIISNESSASALIQFKRIASIRSGEWKLLK